MEALKDGLLLADLRYTFENGQVIEVYPDDNRALLYADLPQYNLPAHIVVKQAPVENPPSREEVYLPSLWEILQKLAQPESF